MSVAFDTLPEAKRFRPLSPTEAIYIRSGTQVVSHSGALGSITPQQFQTALAALEAHYPILRAAIQDGDFIEHEPSPEARFSWLDRTAHDLEALYDEALSLPLDLTTSIYTLQVLEQHPIKWNHLIG